MGYLKYVRELWKKPSKELLRGRVIEWRKGSTVSRTERPVRIDRARSVGYKAKKGYVIARVKQLRGGRQRPLIKKGRRSKHRRRRKIVGKSYRWIAEEKANRKFKNCEVIGSYLLAKDGQYYYHEVILLDRELGKKYPKAKGIAKQKGKVFRGLTSAGRKSRGLRHKGKGAEKVRPSLRANERRGKN
ncbi:MAG: 50S ribosomal protein L15e [Nanoarchaeota archaeon]|nr:50S ribosomal protein L15e [Nanoarchaeota archaeon]